MHVTPPVATLHSVFCSRNRISDPKPKAAALVNLMTKLKMQNKCFKRVRVPTLFIAVKDGSTGRHLKGKGWRAFPHNHPMVFRLPTHLEAFVPPPSSQVPQSTPWRGSIVVSGMRVSDKNGNQDLRVTAVETDGDNRADLWPTQFFAQLTYERPILRDVQVWVKRNAPPICTFMPDRIRDPNSNTVNQAHFRSLSRILFENQMVAIARWNTEKIPGDGIIIFPAQNSSALLVGALFLSSPFPDFALVSSPMESLSPAVTQSRHSQYQPSIASSSSFVPSARHGQGLTHSSAHRSVHPNHDHASAAHRHDQYRYIMPRTLPHPYPTPSSSSPTDPTWSLVKGEDNTDFSTLPTIRGSSHYPQ